jgi:hypothetical protein
MEMSHTLDVLTQPARAVTSRFEIAARRMVDGWLEARVMRCSAEDVALAVDFLARCGLHAEPLPGLEVRLTSERGRTTTISRERAVLTALRCLAALDAQHTTPRPIPRAA